MKKIIFLTVSLLMSSMISLSAQHSEYDDDSRWREGNRYKNQNDYHQIDRSEARAIRNARKELKWTIRQAESDGFVSRREARKIRRIEHRLDLLIKDARHHDSGTYCRR